MEFNFDGYLVTDKHYRLSLSFSLITLSFYDDHLYIFMRVSNFTEKFDSK